MTLRVRGQHERRIHIPSPYLCCARGDYGGYVGVWVGGGVKKIVVPVSGGKDSQACLKMAVKEHGPDSVLGLFCDTQFEHPKTYQHIDYISDLYGVEIKAITAGSVEEKVRKYGRFPVGGARHCTEELKIVPSKKFYKKMAEDQGPFTVYYGMRLAESPDREKRYAHKTNTDLYPPHRVLDKYPKYLEKLGVMFCLPILFWTTHEVFDFLDGEHNPLYDAGFERVGCFPCLAGGDVSKERAFAYDEFGLSQRIKVRDLEKETGKSVWTSKGGSQRNNENQLDIFEGGGCDICSI